MRAPQHPEISDRPASHERPGLPERFSPRRERLRRSSPKLLAPGRCIPAVLLTLVVGGCADRDARADLDPSAAGAESCALPGFGGGARTRAALLETAGVYGAISEERLVGYIRDQVAISHRQRDAGAQFWGRIIGTESDHESAAWMAEALRGVGAEVRVEPIELGPQWIPHAWEVAASAGTEVLPLPSAYPAYGTAATPEGGLDLEVVYLGWGTEADMAGRDVRGKAAVIHSMPMASSIRHSATQNGALLRAQERGAAAIFVVIEIPGNLQISLFPPGTQIPTFALREKVESGRVRLRVRLDAEMVPGLTTSNVWGEIPAGPEGAGEAVVVVAHRDAFFEGISDNATGVATALGLAAHYAQVPIEDRRRTLRILGTPGHHDLDGIGQEWLLAHLDTDLAGTALLINAEHTGHALLDRWGDALMPTDAVGVFTWTVNGSPVLHRIADCAFDEFGIPRWEEMGGPTGEFAPVRTLLPSLGLMHAAILLHSDAMETIPAEAVVATTRAYARIIDAVNELAMDALVAPEATASSDARTP